MPPGRPEIDRLECWPELAMWLPVGQAPPGKFEASSWPVSCGANETPMASARRATSSAAVGKR